MLATALPRIVITGSECTGKTTLAADLARHFGTVWVAEHARAYAERKEGSLTADDVVAIAQGQIADEERAMAHARRILVLDTDLLSTLVYAAHYYGDRPSWIRAAAHLRRGSLYLLCHPDVPWIADGVRDRPDAREAIHSQFADELSRLGAQVVDVRGSWQERLATGVAAVEQLLREAAATPG